MFSTTVTWNCRGEANDRHHGHAGLDHHRRPIDGFLPVLLKSRRKHGLVEQVVETVIQAISHKGAYREKGEQFDQRLKGNGKHHAPVVFCGVEVARAKQDSEQRQHQRHDQCRVLDPGAGGVGASPDQQVNPEHNTRRLPGRYKAALPPGRSVPPQSPATGICRSGRR